MSRTTPSTKDLLKRMATTESEFLKSEFLAPLLPGGIVHVRIAGIVCRLRVEGDGEPGWAVFRPVTLGRACVVRRASLAQVRDYLALFPSVRLVLIATAEEWPFWLALKAHRGDTRIRVDGPVHVYLAKDVQPFDTVASRFDGTHFWFEAKDRRRTPAIAEYLRESLAKDRNPRELRKKTLTAEEKDAYRMAWDAAEKARKGGVQLRLERALAHAGAEFGSYLERADAYTVRYVVDGRPFTTTVRKDDLTVLVAGICLAGEDERFDLTSLVGVLREEDAESAPRVGPGGMPEGDYRRAYPRD